MTPESNLQAPKQYFWTPKQIMIASGLAGPIVGCYFLGRNYARLGKFRAATTSYIAGCIGMVVFLCLFALIPESIMSKIPPVVVAIVPAAIIASFSFDKQKREVEERLKEGSKNYSYWWWLLMTLSMFIVQMPFLLLIALTFGKLVV